MMLEYLDRPTLIGDWAEITELTRKQLWKCIGHAWLGMMFENRGLGQRKDFTLSQYRLVSKESVAKAIESTSDSYYDEMLDEYNQKFAIHVQGPSTTWEIYSPDICERTNAIDFGIFTHRILDSSFIGYSGYERRKIPFVDMIPSYTIRSAEGYSKLTAGTWSQLIEQCKAHE